jgi:ceramide glucosyltransferase
MTISAFAAGICVSSAGIHALSIGLAMRRCARRREPTPVPKDAPAVTIVQPLRGVEPFSPETLRSIFALDYPNYEIIFCLAEADDPIAPIPSSTMW